MLPAAESRRVRAAIGAILASLTMVAVLRCSKGDHGTRSGDAASESTARPEQTPQKRVIYRSTMNPGEVSNTPGKDSMGMEMVPVEMEEGTSNVEGLADVRIPLPKQELIGVRTAVAKRAPLVRIVRAVGRVTADETRLHHVHTKVGGWIETLYADATGEKVLRGQPLLSLYSPELLATQGEYLVALRSSRDMKESTLPRAARDADDLVESARQRLLLYDLTPAQIRHLEESGEASRTITLYAPITGFVIARKVSHGERIEPDTSLLDIADLSRIWVIASVYEYELPFVKVGQKATMTLEYVPGKSFRGRVTLVYPVLDAATRTAQVRLEFDNPDLTLKPEMYARVELEGDLGPRLSVPDSAVISTGVRDIVFVKQGDGSFAPREVKVGLRLADRFEILDGLEEGESVVVAGNFLIDSESKMKAALQAAPAPPATTAPPKERR